MYTELIGLFIATFLFYISYNAFSHDVKDSDDAYIEANSKMIDIRGKKLSVLHVGHENGANVPLILFIHGLGGQKVQFVNQIKHFAQVANVLAVDFVGFGSSEKVLNDAMYTSDSIALDIVQVLALYPKRSSIVAHSYGARISIKVLKTLNYQDVSALILLAPKSAVTQKEQRTFEFVKKSSLVTLNILRFLDRIGGIKSKSVCRMMGTRATDEMKLKQLKWNKASSTRSLQQLIRGMDWPCKSDYDSISVPVLLIGGEFDVVTPIDPNLNDLYLWILKGGHCPSVKKYSVQYSGHNIMCEYPQICNALIYNFLTRKCKIKEMSREEQIKWERYDPKWSVKNYEKWKQTSCVSQKVGPSVSFPLFFFDDQKFRPMKTLKQDDSEHHPQKLIQSHSDIKLIIDISKDEPTYNTNYFSNESGCSYHKLPTVSKVPPTEEQAQEFIRISRDFWKSNPDASIGVHCHYGFNRTGFLVCCWLIQEVGLSVNEAIQAFQESRPPGIRYFFNGKANIKTCSFQE